MHADEWVVVDGALDLVKRNSFEPTQFSRPDHLEIQLSYLLYEAYAHLIHGTDPISLYASDPGLFTALSRLLIAGLGTLCIPVAYLAVATFGRWMPVTAAAMVAFFPPFVEHAHYATPDVPLVLVTFLVVWACVRYIESPRWKWLVLACASTAWGFTAKYPAALLGAVVAASVVTVAVRDRNWRRSLWHALSSPVLFVVCVFIASPVLLTNFAAVEAQLTGQNSTGHLGADGLGYFGKLGFYATNGLTSLGLILTVCALFGVLRLIRLRALHAIPLLAGGVLWLAISALTLHWDRWGIPMYVTPILLAAIGIPELARVLRRVKLSRRIATIVIAGVVGVAGLSLVLTSLATTARFVSEDSRSAALAYVNEHGITPEITVYEGYTPFLPGSSRTVFDEFELSDEGTLMPVAAVNGETPPHYLILSSIMSERFKAEARYANEQAFYTAVQNQFALVAEWEGAASAVASNPVELVNIPGQLVNAVRSITGSQLGGPTILIYEIPGAATAETP
ncbi:ArnT family glycosyltransferase [Leucobacter ruminantium]|uniref:Glycosyltransferase family 39 protein n=1 Tax=Leucobacter ruminantium TaxID=1289170 RepID=A0A939M002_9MICO|nr:glycosyltransferase family 39 protein [Leucobacter ruminantium]MBO1805547.1 glycosyltransferase family 39 protein [Leucobacter ruminantium]